MRITPPPTRRRVASAAAALVTSAGLLTFAGSASADGGATQFDTKITNAVNVDPNAETVTLPLLQGDHNGQAVYYVVTDDSNRADAQARGVNWAPKLANALGTPAVQRAGLVGGAIEFPGIVHFGEQRVVTPGPAGNEFLGGTYHQGASGDATYSPLVTTGNGIVLNASQIADDSGVHNSVVSIDKARHQVTLRSFFGFWNGHRTLYLHLDASNVAVAAAEASTYAPNLDASPGVASNDPKTSTRSAIIPVVNGQTGVGNPNRQGLNSALRGEGDPQNINQDIPGQGNGRYSPVWDIHPLLWTQAAIDSGQRVLLTSASDVANAFAHGLITSAGGGPANAGLNGLRAGPFISNCPIVAVA